MNSTIKQLMDCRHQLEAVSDSSQLDVELLLAFVLKKTRETLYTWPDQNVDSAQVQAFHDLLERRQKGEPVAYLIGKKAFWDFDLLVNSHVLIPRPETELLVEKSLSLMSDVSLSAEGSIKVCDLGTGSGAIALALGYERPAWSVTAVDSSSAALQVARENCQNLSLSNVDFVLSNWCEQLTENEFDLIVSNPPYIDENDPHLSQGDVRFEPANALVSANHGLSDITKISLQVKDILKPGGWLLFEHGFEQGNAVTTILLDNDYQNIKTFQDLAGHPRLTAAQR